MSEKNPQLLEQWEEFFRARVRKRLELTAGYVKYVARLSEQDLPPIFELSHLASLIGIDAWMLASLVTAPERHYRDFIIPKRRGGERRISVPSPALLACQRWIVREVLTKIDVSPWAHGFVPRRSIRTNVEPHLGNLHLLKLDLESFFPSIPLRRIVAIFLRAGYPPNVSFYLASLCCLEGRLPQGAPTSPALSNIVAKRLDARLGAFAAKQGLVYTRYADDLTFSGASIDPSILSFLNTTIMDEGFQLNISKTVFRGAGRKKIVTGVSISSGKAKLPRETRRKIRQECHFLLTRGFDQHTAAIGVRDPIYVERVIGRLGYWLQIEPDNEAAAKLMAGVREVQKQLGTDVIAA